MNDYFRYLWLSRLNIDPIKIKRLLKLYSIKNFLNLKETDLKDVLTQEECTRFLNKTYSQNLEKYEKFLKEKNINFITINDERFPTSLKNIEDGPIALYTIGNEKLLNEKSIAIVGSRDCSEYGKTMSQAFSYLLAKNNITIVSGLAKGIDTNAHEGALLAKGNTIAVIGTGIDYIYPKENKGLMENIIKSQGLIISEYPLGTKPQKENFPKRNRIISGISEGVFVIEAGEKSGALITVNYALEQGKDVYALPRKYYK